ncbi:MAG: D-2-hydroxyacid dehydrogenase [Haliea sp.]|uniref:D-2-hydroxyacid dehydrogenase n=1 Tax=Haliea sp. TaxID=1932666 RepID=UPI0032EE2271
MPDIRAALVTLPWSETLIGSLREALAPAEVVLANRHDRAAISAALKRVDVALIAGDIDSRHVQAPHLKWVHCGHAGLDRSATPAAFARGLSITSSAGRSAPALAEHAMLFMLALGFRLDRFHAAQRAHRWGVSGQKELRPLHGKTLGIIGLGHTGMELAKRARAFDMRVVGYRRRETGCAWVDRVYSRDGGDSLNTLLAQSDFVVLAVPLSDSTHRLIGAPEFAAMQATAYLINMARGKVVDQNALILALRAGRLAGAAIDVAEEEPLPARSPLWDVPNLLITPHFTPPMADRDERALALLLENLRRYRADEPLLNLLTVDDLYSSGDRKQNGGSTLAALLRDIPRRGRRVQHWLRTR